MKPIPSPSHNIKFCPLCRILSGVLIQVSCIWLLASCQSTAPLVTQPRNDSIILRHHYAHDSIYVHDSVFTRYAIGNPDTNRQNHRSLIANRVDTVLVERWHTDVRYKIQAQTDTIWQDKEVVVTLPPERYVPQFYKWCAWIVLAMVVYIIVRVAVRVFL